jgi:hypothetical protein
LNVNDTAVIFSGYLPVTSLKRHIANILRVLGEYCFVRVCVCVRACVFRPQLKWKHYNNTEVQ